MPALLRHGVHLVQSVRQILRPGVRPQDQMPVEPFFDQRRDPGQILFPENGLVANLPIIQYARLFKYYMLIMGLAPGYFPIRQSEMKSWAIFSFTDSTFT